MKQTASKALTAAVLAFAGALGAEMADGNVTVAEVIIAAGVALVTGAGTYSIPNKTLVPADGGSVE